MPELPEVEVVRRGLQSHVRGRRISEVQVLHDRAVRRHTGGRTDFEAILRGHTITDVRRRGKYLWFALDDGDAVLAHLGMSGQFRVDDPTPEELGALHPHLRVRFRFDDGGRHLDFLDQRTFGGLAFVPGGAELPEPIAHLALDPMDPAYDRAATIDRLRAKRTELKRALLDQTVVSGIGNIYADEALWAAKLHYARPTASLTRSAAGRVLDEAAAVMKRALAVGGTSFDSRYVNVNGESGYFDRALHAYGQEGQPCERCGATIRREPFMNRSSFFCPRCQRPSRNRD